jgi:hypothetical protein
MTAKILIPKEIILATNLLWASCFFSVIDAFRWATEAAYLLIGFCLTLGMYYWIISEVKKGKNWMRILIAALFIITTLVTIKNRSLDLMWLLINGTFIAALFLLFSKNATKFFNTKSTSKT